MERLMSRQVRETPLLHTKDVLSEARISMTPHVRQSSNNVRNANWKPGAREAWFCVSWEVRALKGSCARSDSLRNGRA